MNHQNTHATETPLFTLKPKLGVALFSSLLPWTLFVIFFGITMVVSLGVTFGVLGIFLGLLGLFVILGLVFIYNLLTFKRTEYQFFKDRVEYCEGFFTKIRKSMPYDKINNFSLQVTWFIDTIFRTGTIVLSTASGHQVKRIGMFIGRDAFGRRNNGADAMTGQGVLFIRYLDAPEQVFRTLQHLLTKTKDMEPDLVVRPNVLAHTASSVLGSLLGALILMFYIFRIGIFTKPIFAGLVLAVITGFSLLILYLNARKTQYLFYSDRLEYYEGFMTKERKIIPYQKITDITQKRTWFIDNIFRTGTILITTAGGIAGHDVALDHINQSDAILTHLHSLIDRYMKKPKQNRYDE